jgi:hypothetical protein
MTKIRKAPKRLGQALSAEVPADQARQEMGTPASRHSLDADPRARKLEKAANHQPVSHEGKDSSNLGDDLGHVKRRKR